MLLPPGDLTFVPFLGRFLVAILLGMVSHVPGGVGVFEGLMLLLLGPYLDATQLLPALVVYRAVYYLLPLAVALAILAADEIDRRRALAARVARALGRYAQRYTPRVLATITFFAGVVLLFSGATPAERGRLLLLVLRHGCAFLAAQLEAPTHSVRKVGSLQTQNVAGYGHGPIRRT